MKVSTQINVNTKWLGKRRFQATGPSGYEVVMDATENYGGDRSGNSPVELVLMGLAGCMGIDVTMILDQMRQKIDELDIVVEGTRSDTPPHGFTEIHLTFDVKGNVPPSRIWRAILLGKEKYCTVSASLNATIQPRVLLNGEEIEQPRETEGE